MGLDFRVAWFGHLGSLACYSFGIIIAVDLVLLLLPTLP
jgi:nitrogen fixation protein FixH